MKNLNEYTIDELIAELESRQMIVAVWDADTVQYTIDRLNDENESETITISPEKREEIMRDIVSDFVNGGIYDEIEFQISNHVQL